MTGSARGGTGGGGRKRQGGGKAKKAAKATKDRTTGKGGKSAEDEKAAKAAKPVNVVQSEAPRDPNDWVVVCVGCLRIKREGVWTDEKVITRAGRSTGYCDVCVAKRRDELRIGRK